MGTVGLAGSIKGQGAIGTAGAVAGRAFTLQALRRAPGAFSGGDPVEAERTRADAARSSLDSGACSEASAIEEDPVVRAADAVGSAAQALLALEVADVAEAVIVESSWGALSDTDLVSIDDFKGTAWQAAGAEVGCVSAGSAGWVAAQAGQGACLLQSSIGAVIQAQPQKQEQIGLTQGAAVASTARNTPAWTGITPVLLPIGSETG